MLQEYKTAGQESFEMMNSPHHPNGGSDPSQMFKEDTAVVQLDNPFTTYDGQKLYTSYVWPMGAEKEDSKEWLTAAFEATGAVGCAALLFTYHKVHQLMDYIPQFLSNPGFLKAHGDQLKKTLVGFMSGKIRNDVLYRYQRLLQTHPVMFNTMHWLNVDVQNEIGSKMYRFGFANALGFVKPETVDIDMVYEAVTNARVNASKRLVKPTDRQYIDMYLHLLELGGHDKVSVAELVDIAMMDWKLAFSFIKARGMNFNDALSVFMTFVYRRGGAAKSTDNYAIVEAVYNHYGPSEQWPGFQNVVAHVNAVTRGAINRPADSQDHRHSSLAGKAVPTGRNESKVSAYL